MNLQKRMVSGALIAVLVLLPATVFAWGWAVHAYVDDQFSTKWAVRNGNQLYGGFGPDMLPVSFFFSPRALR